MCYDSIFLFADKEQDNFRTFWLVRYQVDNPEGEQVIIPGGRAATLTHSMPSSPASSIGTDCKIVASVESKETHTIYTHTDPDNWMCLEKGASRCDIDPVPYTGEENEFSVDVTEEEVCDKLTDDNGDIRFYKVLEWCLPYSEARMIQCL